MAAMEKSTSFDDLQAENSLLLMQLHLVQEEFERFYLQSKYQNKQPVLLENRGKRPQGVPLPKLTFLQKCTDRLGYTNHRDIAEIRGSEYMDVAWYLEQNPDVKQSGMDAVEHYYKYGWKEGRVPSPQFNSLVYLNNYPDVASVNVEPLLHYLRYGQEEGRSCFGVPFFSENSVLLAQIEELESEKTSSASKLHQLQQDHRKQQSKYHLLKNDHQQLEKSYQREHDDWQKAKAVYMEQIKQQENANGQKSELIEQLQQQLEQHRIDYAGLEDVIKKSQVNAVQQEEVIKQSQVLVLELQGQLMQLTNRYEQVKELQRFEREAWEKTEAAYKVESRQYKEMSSQQKMTIEQLQQQLESQATLALSLESTKKIAAERLNKINELQQKIQSLQASEVELAARQQMMHEEMVRAEAQLDLVKDMILRESAL